jgi:thiamine biosynthesis lipoprotein
MATLFEVFLVGDDPEHLEAVGESALDEVERLERVLSCHDPAAELHRVNRSAWPGPVTVTRELADVLLACSRAHAETGGAFDPCFGCGVAFAEAVTLDEASRRVRFRDPRTRIDLGGYGKGVAADAATDVLVSLGVTDFLVHGGTSSVRASGVRADGRAWAVELRPPFPPGSRIELRDEAMSCSANDGTGPSTVDPRSGDVATGTACAIVAPTASVAEVWSTAALVRGAGVRFPAGVSGRFS